MLRGHAAPVADVEFSPDGRWIASASHDGTAKIWDSTAVEAAIALPHAALGFACGLHPGRLGHRLGLLGQPHSDLGCGDPPRSPGFRRRTEHPLPTDRACRTGGFRPHPQPGDQPRWLSDRLDQSERDRDALGRVHGPIGPHPAAGIGIGLSASPSIPAATSSPRRAGTAPSGSGMSRRGNRSASSAGRGARRSRLSTARMVRGSPRRSPMGPSGSGIPAMARRFGDWPPRVRGA